MKERKEGRKRVVILLMWGSLEWKYLYCLEGLDIVLCVARGVGNMVFSLERKM